MEKLAGTKVCVQKVEGPRRLRGALSPLLSAAALGCWLNAGAAYALDVPPEAALQDDAELLPVTLNPPGASLVFGADEHCSSPVPAPEDAAANVQMDVAGPENGTQMEPEDSVLAATAKTACVPLAAAFAAAGEPVFAAHAAGMGFGFSATLGQLAMFAGVPAAVAGVARAVGRRNGGGNSAMPPNGNGPGNGPGGPGRGPGPGNGPGPGAGPGGGGPGGNPATPTPEPVSTVLLIAGAALVGRAVQRHAGR